MKPIESIRADVEAKLITAIPDISRFVSDPRYSHGQIYAVADVADDGTCTDIAIYKRFGSKPDKHEWAIGCVMISRCIENIYLDFSSVGDHDARQNAIDGITNKIVRHVHCHEKHRK